MKLSLPLFLLALSSPVLSFAPSFIAKSRVTHQTLMAGGFIGKLFGDRDDKSIKDKATDKLFKRITKGKLPKFKNEPNEGEPEEQGPPGVFQHLPTKEMTGVDVDIFRLCSTISSQLYTMNSFDEFKLSTKDMKTELLIYDDKGDFKATSPPFLAAITGKTMILGWRGTSGLLDGINDIALSPQSSFAWRKHADTIKAQGAMTGIVHNDIVAHEKAMIEKAKEAGVTEIITTGQSLGGGCAQIGHLTLRAQIEDETSPWNELEGVNVRSVCFCGPMTTALVDNEDANPETDEFIEKLWKNSCNVVHSNDWVPRAYGYYEFIFDFLEDPLDDLVIYGPGKFKHLNGLLGNMLNIQEKILDLAQNVGSKDQVVDILEAISQYRHMGTLVYYKDKDAEPIALKDMGHAYSKTDKEDFMFRSVEYEPVKLTEKGELFNKFMGWHMDPIQGPGLSYPDDELMK